MSTSNFECWGLCLLDLGTFFCDSGVLGVHQTPKTPKFFFFAFCPQNKTKMSVLGEIRRCARARPPEENPRAENGPPERKNGPGAEK